MATLNLNEKKIPSAENLRLIAQLCISLANKQSSLEDRCIAPWKSGEVYQKDISYVSYNNYLYFCTVSNSDTDFVESHWTKLSDTISELTKSDIEALVNLTHEQIANLQSLIDDTSISTTHTNSSSHIYMAIQDAIAECKDDTLKQIAKKVSGSYKIANTTADIVSADYIYLLSNGTNYDLYVLVDGTATKVGDTNIDLSEYVKTTDLADYMKTSDADGKFATITTVDGKVNKTDIVDNLTSTDTDKPLSANQGKVLKDEVDLKANDSDVVKKTDISTSIDSASTDDEIPTSKAVETRILKRETIKNVDLNTFVDEGKYYIDSGCTNSPVDGGYLNIMRCNDDYVCQICARYNIAASNNTYIRTRVDGKWGTWKKVCTTSVVDVPLTSLAWAETTYFENTFTGCFYQVKNGVCFVNIDMICNAPMTGGYKLPLTLPKPATEYVHFSVSSLPNGAYESSSITIAVTSNGTHIVAYGGVATHRYLGMLSYPVAES